MEEPAQQEFRTPDRVEATRKNLDRLRASAGRKAPTLEELAALREQVKARRVEDDVKIVRLDGPMSIWAWLCKRHRENLKPGWFVAETKDAPHPLVCEKCTREARR